MPTKTEIMEKIESKIYRDSNGCWIWMGSVNQTGRPKIHFDERRFGGKMYTLLPHIILYEEDYGDFEERYLDSACGNLRCVNPDHNQPRTLEIRMKNYVENENECWEWQGNVSEETGYGSITVDGKSVSTHRLSYQMNIGDIPDGLMVLHTCDNKICINPSHLYAGTHNKNMQDMVERGLSTKGEKNGMAVLNKENVLEIKELIKSRTITYANIAKKFGVSRSAIKDIASGRTWGWVK